MTTRRTPGRRTPGYDGLDWSEKDALRRALRGGASRRDLLRMLLAAGMAPAIGATVAGHATRAFAQTPKKGGSLRVATYASSMADTLDPAKAKFNIDYLRINSIYNGLTWLDETLTPRMALAEAIETDDATVWTVKLRKGVSFHDGKALTADDVVYSLIRHLDPAVGSSSKSLASQFSEVKKAGAHDLTITLKAPNADLPAILGTPGFLIVQDGTTDFSKPAGTGAFRIQDFVPGDRSLAVANPNYWKPGGGPYLDQFELFAIQDETARVNALIAGDVDVIANVSGRSARLVTSTPDLELLRTVAGQFTDMIMRVDIEPGANAAFVKAMKHLFNREQIVQAVFRGYAQVGNDQPIPPSSRYYASDNPAPAYDPDLAKSLLAKAGLLNTSIPVVASPASYQSVEIAMVLQQAAMNIGLDLDIQKVPADGYWSNYWLKSPICFGTINPRPTPDIMFSQFYDSSANWNEAHWRNERFDRLLREARGLTDEAKRKELYGEMQGIVSQDGGVAIPIFIDGIDAHKSKVKGFKPLPTGNLMGNAFAEYVWLDG